MDYNDKTLFTRKFKPYSLKPDFKLNVIDKSKPKPKRRDQILDDFKPFILPKSVPAELLPSMKETPRLRDVVHPDNWISQESEKKPTRQEVFATERENIAKVIQRHQGFHRPTRCLNKGITCDPVNKFEDTFNYDTPDAMAASMINVNRERKSRSKEYLQAVFDRARTYAQETRIQKLKQVSKKKSVFKGKPRLATGVDPDADEIVL